MMKYVIGKLCDLSVNRDQRLTDHSHYDHYYGYLAELVTAKVVRYMYPRSVAVTKANN